MGEGLIPYVTPAARRSSGDINGAEVYLQVPESFSDPEHGNNIMRRYRRSSCHRIS